MTRSTRWMGFAATMVACAGLTACSSVSNGATPAGTSTTTRATAPTTAPATTTPTPTTTVTATVTATAKPLVISTSTKDAAKEATLSDGKHYVFIKKVTAAKRTIVVDVVQHLSGAAAEKAAAEDGYQTYDDQYYRNANPLLRTLPVTAAARITVNSLAWKESDSATKDVPKTLAQLGGYRDLDLDQYLFTVTVAGGKVTGIAQAFLP